MEKLSKVKTYCVLGAMSGTSLDGLDLALVKLSNQNGNWSFKLLNCKSIDYNTLWKSRLQTAFDTHQNKLSELDNTFGKFIGLEIHRFLNEAKIQPDFIASHGHTVFHEPQNGLTVQIGSAKEIHEHTLIPVINDFRSKDVSLGGQGAPLVPIGDRYLFSQYDFCLNLGGIANVSHETENGRIAFDICPFNMAMNYLSEQKGLPFDDQGQLAQSGNLIPDMLDDLNSIAYCDKPSPKSLGYEEFLAFWKPIIDGYGGSVEDKLRTFVVHAGHQIVSSLAAPNEQKPVSLLVTGGGAFNDFFISMLSKLSGVEVTLPPKEIIEFKEAIVFALLGVLRFRNEPNCLASVTGAESDNCGGEMYGF